MDVLETNLKNLQSKVIETGLNSSRMLLHGVFSERKGLYLNEYNLFLAHFNTIPNFTHEIKIKKNGNQYRT